MNTKRITEISSIICFRVEYPIYRDDLDLCFDEYLKQNAQTHSFFLRDRKTELLQKIKTE
jgi:hypothetical protein